MPIAKATFTIRDAKNALAQTSIYIEFLDTISDEDGRDSPFAFALYYAELLDAVIDGAIVGIHVGTSLNVPDGLKETPVLRSDVEDGAEFIYECLQGSIAKQVIPTFSEDFVFPDGTVDQSPTEMFDLLYLTENPEDTPGDWAVRVVSVNGDDIINTRRATQKFKKSRKLKT